MFESPTSDSRSPSPWWALLLLPAGLFVGWIVGGLPVPKPRESKPAETRSASTVAAAAEAPQARTAALGGAEHRGWPQDPAPAVVEHSAPQPERGEISSWTTLDNALEESRRNGKPVLIDFSADWCGPCRALKQQLFEDGAGGRAVQSAVIPVSIVDRVRENGSNPSEIESLQRRYDVDAFPTLVVFSPQSGRIMKTKGFGGADATLAWITEAAKAVR